MEQWSPTTILLCLSFMKKALFWSLWNWIYEVLSDADVAVILTRIILIHHVWISENVRMLVDTRNALAADDLGAGTAGSLRASLFFVILVSYHD